jgi:hypothetical protein
MRTCTHLVVLTPNGSETQQQHIAMKLSRGSVCRYCSFDLSNKQLRRYQYRLSYKAVFQDILKFKEPVFNEPVISQCVSRALFYSSE